MIGPWTNSAVNTIPMGTKINSRGIINLDIRGKIEKVYVWDCPFMLAVILPVPFIKYPGSGMAMGISILANGGMVL